MVAGDQPARPQDDGRAVVRDPRKDVVNLGVIILHERGHTALPVAIRIFPRQDLMRLEIVSPRYNGVTVCGHGDMRVQGVAPKLLRLVPRASGYVEATCPDVGFRLLGLVYLTPGRKTVAETVDGDGGGIDKWLGEDNRCAPRVSAGIVSSGVEVAGD